MILFFVSNAFSQGVEANTLSRVIIQKVHEENADEALAETRASTIYHNDMENATKEPQKKDYGNRYRYHRQRNFTNDIWKTICKT